jgi:hypothetical protein
VAVCAGFFYFVLAETARFVSPLLSGELAVWSVSGLENCRKEGIMVYIVMSDETVERCFSSMPLAEIYCKAHPKSTHWISVHIIFDTVD